MSNPKYDPSLRADTNRFLDNRAGYSGHLIRGQAPYLLIEEAVRNRITESLYFKEQCFGLNAATLCDRAAALTYVGGTYSDGRRASPFLCLIFKMLQLNLDEEILEVYLKEGGETFKYLRVLTAFYLRLTSEKSVDVYRALEPHLEDARKLRFRNPDGYFRLTHVDEFVDQLLTEERVCSTSLWRLRPRETCEDEDGLEEYISPVAHLVEDEEEEEKVKTETNGVSDDDMRSDSAED